MPKKVAIIGGGSSGLTAIKCCLDEELEPVCFEKLSTIGGLWYYRDELVDGVASVMKTTIINTSKEMSAFSNFPPPKEYANFMHNIELMKYLTSYMEHFGLKKYIKFRHEVLKVERSGTSVPAKWRVVFKDKTTEKTSEDVFDGVLVCSGHHTYPHKTKLPGMEKFKGEIVHSHDLKTCKKYEGKNAVILGIGNSAVDAAVEMSNVTKQIYLSTRRGAWTIGRVWTKGAPFDFFTTRFNNFLYKYLPRWYYTEAAEKDLNKRFDHALYGLKPKHAPDAQHPTITDDLPVRILSGRIVIKPNIKTLTETGIIFEDDSVVENVDVLVLCTGYEIKFPFLDQDIVSIVNNKVSLYKLVYPPKQELGTLALIGLIQPIGCIFPVAELQCRWATRIIKGDLHLPDNAEMLADIKTKHTALSKRYVDSPRHTIQVDFVAYTSELSEQIGSKPDILKLMLTDPVLGWKCLFGPCVPYQYRLFGRHKWDGAREAILSVPYRAAFPLQSRDIPGGYSNYISYFFSLIVIGLIAYVIFFYKNN